jgi:hypothetical protein
VRALREVRGTALVAVLAGVAYGLTFPYRLDYLGHFLAGFGGTLLLLAVVALAVPRPLEWLPFVTGVASIAIGALAEKTVFHVAVFDPVDFCNQSLGAALAVCGVTGRSGSRPLFAVLVLLGVVVLGAGVGFSL